MAFPHLFVDINATRVSLAKLLQYDCDILCFAHGAPILKHGQSKLQKFLNDDEIWADFAVMSSDESASSDDKTDA